MSDNLYWTRLRWHGRGGIAKHLGKSIVLDLAPDLGSGPIWDCDYVPEVDIADVQTRSIDPVRRMTHSEIRAADDILKGLTNA